MKRIKVSEGQTWAVYKDAEQAVAEGTFLPVPTAAPSFPKSTSAGTSLPPRLLGLQNPFFFTLLDPKAANFICLRWGRLPTAGSTCAACAYCQAEHSTPGPAAFHPAVYWDWLGLYVWGFLHCITRGKSQ